LKRGIVALAIALWLCGCSSEPPPGGNDSGTTKRDSGFVGFDAEPGGDGSTNPDAAEADGGGGLDAETIDSGVITDAGMPSDAALPDAASIDAGSVDAGTPIGPRRGGLSAAANEAKSGAFRLRGAFRPSTGRASGNQHQLQGGLRASTPR
jgi:hypothetical protein